jgi:acid phosphatase (class A)
MSTSHTMKMFRYLLISGLSCLVLAQTSVKTPRAAPFVTAAQLDMKALLPSPPATDSETTRRDLVELYYIEESRTAAQIAAARADEAEEDIFIFRNVLGDKFTSAALPVTAALSSRIRANEGVIVSPAKNFFRRTRPYHLDPTLKPVCKVKPPGADYSYPSDHSTIGYLEALTLVQIVPEKRDAILARADDYAHNRIVCGAHFPSDPVASRLVAYAMIGLMINNPDYKRELEAARAETRRVLGL